MAMAVTSETVDMAFEDFELARNNYLRGKGWENVCNVPGSFWFWQKALLDGRIVLLDAAGAKSIQDSMDYFEAEQGV